MSTRFLLHSSHPTHSNRSTISRPTRFAAIALGAALLTGCAGAPESESEASDSEDFPITIESCGFESTVNDAASSVITMNQGATEVVLALDAADQLAGTAYLDDAVPEQWQDAYNSVPVLSDSYPDLETILAENPDLIYGSYGSAFGPEAAGDRENLEADGIASYVSPLGCGSDFDGPETSFETVWSEVDDIAAALGVPGRAEDIRDEQQKVLNDLAEESAGSGTTIFWYDSGEDTAFTGTGGGGPQLIIDAIGATNPFADIDSGWADISWEDVLAADPDVIVFADAAWSTAEDKIAYLQNDPVLSELRAVQAEAFITIPFSESTPGVRLTDGAQSVADQLNALN